MMTRSGSGDTSPARPARPLFHPTWLDTEEFRDPKKRVSSRSPVAEVAGFTTRVEPAGRKPDRCIPAATVIPVLIYPDVREAVAWLSAAFGFAARVRIGENHRAQFRVGAGAVIVGDVRGDRRPPRPGEVTHSVMVRVDDAHAHCERAHTHGAGILTEPTDFEYGERQFTARTPPATNGRSPKPSPTLPPRDGAGNPSTPSDHDDPHPTRPRCSTSGLPARRAAAMSVEVRPNCRAGFPEDVVVGATSSADPHHSGAA